MEEYEDFGNEQDSQISTELIWEKSLYSCVKVVEGNLDSHKVLYDILFGSHTHDAHCVMCGRQSTFKREGRDDIFELYSNTGKSLNWQKKEIPLWKLGSRQ